MYRNIFLFDLKIFISRVEVRKLPIFVGGRWGSLAEKLSLLSPPGPPLYFWCENNRKSIKNICIVMIFSRISITDRLIANSSVLIPGAQQFPKRCDLKKRAKEIRGIKVFAVFIYYSNDV